MAGVRNGIAATASIAALAAACLATPAHAAPYGYVDDFVADRISQYDLANGGLQPLKPPHVAVGDRPNLPVLTPDGRHLYVPNAGTNTISQFAVDPRGRLAPLSPSEVPSPIPLDIVVTANGRFAYAIEFATTVTEYAIRSNGTLTAIGTVTVPPTDEGDTAYLDSVALSPDGRHAYVGEGFILGHGSIHEYNVGPAGHLTPMSPPSIVQDQTPLELVASPNGRNLYSAGRTPIFQYTIRPNGTLKPLQPAGVSARTSYGPTVSPDGRHLYAAAANDDGVWQLGIGPAGALSPLEPALAPAGRDPSSVRLTENGRWAYVTNSGGNEGKGSSISRYVVRGDGRLIRNGPPIPKSGAPFGMAITPDVADLVLTAQAEPARPSVGDQVTFTLTARNLGPATATRLVVSDRLPARLRFKSTNTAGQCTHGDGRVTCRLPSLAGGDSAKVVIKASVQSSGPASDDAHVSARQRDLHARNNRAHATVRAGKTAR